MKRQIKSVYIPFRLSPAQAQAVKDLAAAQNTTVSDIIRRALAAFVKDEHRYKKGT